MSDHCRHPHTSVYTHKQDTIYTELKIIFNFKNILLNKDLNQTG